MGFKLVTVGEGPISIDGSHVLAKSTCDPYLYACRLKTGEAFVFEDATVEEDFVHFNNVRLLENFPDQVVQRVDSGPWFEKEGSLQRGLDVRKDQIVWLIDSAS
jgi:hypothetical protein